MRLTRGKGSEKTGACWMSAIAWYAGNSWTDHPDCVSRAVSSVGITINDMVTDDRREAIIGPHLMAPIGTATSGDDEILRVAVANRRSRELAMMARSLHFPSGGDQDVLDCYRGAPSWLDRLRSMAILASPLSLELGARVIVSRGRDHFTKVVTAVAWTASQGWQDSQASAAARLLEDAAERFMLPVLLEMCEVGTRKGVPQKRLFSSLPGGDVSASVLKTAAAAPVPVGP